MPIDIGNSKLDPINTNTSPAASGMESGGINIGNSQLDIDISGSIITSTPEWEEAKQGIGFVEAFTQDPNKFIPIFGSLNNALDMARVVEAGRRLDLDDYKNAKPSVSQQMSMMSPYSFASNAARNTAEYRLQTGEISAKQADLEVVSDWWTNIQEQKDRGYSFGGAIGLIASEMPSFMTEFAITGGAANLGKKATQEFLEKHLKGKLSKKVSKELLGRFASAGVRTPMMMSRVASAYAERRLPKSVVLKDGALTFDWPKDKPFTSFAKAYGDIFTEAFSEELGEFVKLPFGKKFAKNLFNKMKLKHPKLTYLQYLKRLSTKTGYNGIIGEMGEEFVGDAIRGAVNIQDFGAGEDADIFERVSAGLKQDWENKWAMAAAFAIPGATKAAAGAALFGVENYMGEAFSIDDIVSQAEAQKTIDDKMAETQRDYIKRSSRPKKKSIDRGPEVRVLSIESDGITPDESYRVPGEAQIEAKVEEDVSDTILEQAQEFHDQGMPLDKAQQWAKKMQEPVEEQPLDKDLIRSAEQISKDMGIPIDQALEIAQKARSTVGGDVPIKESPELRAEQIIQQNEPEPPTPAPVSKADKQRFQPVAKRLEIIRRAKEAATQKSILTSAKELADETGMEITQAVDFVRRLRGEQKDTAAPGSVVRAQLGKRNAAILRIASGNRENFDNLMAYVEASGGLVDNPDMVALQLENLRTMAIHHRKLKNKQRSLTSEDKKKSILNPYQAIRYALANIELATTFPIRSLYRKMNIKHNRVRREIENEVRTALENAGMTPETLSLTTEENDLIKDWLFSGNQESFKKLSKPNQALAQQLKNLLQGRGAKDVRGVRWKLWKKLGIVPAGIKKGQNPGDIFREGIAAEEDGSIGSWLSKQTWGARENYYMSEGFEDPIDTLLDLFDSGTLLENAVSKTPGVTPGEARTRTAARTYKKGLVLNNIHTHLTRLALANALFDDVNVFWSALNNADPSKTDLSNMKMFITHMLGKSFPTDTPVKIARIARSMFWHLYFADPFKSAYFFTRNSLQNISYLPSQLALNEVRKSGKNLVAQKTLGTQDQERVEDFGVNWEDDINQKKKLYQEAILAREETTAFEKNNKKLINKAVRFSEKLSSWALSSDVYNRTVAWHMFYDAAQRNFKDYQDGRISFGRMRRRLKLDVLDVTQVNEILVELNKGQTRSATNLYATYKTENVHFRYDTTLRGAVEQSPAGRILTGLVVYPRGVFNLAYRNGALPLVEGLKTGDFDKAYQALGEILSLVVFTALSRRILKALTGRDSYGIPTYAPIDPGISLIQRMAEDASRTQGRSAGTTAKIMASNLEFAIPMVHAFTNIYESQNDKAGVRYWQLVLIVLKADYKRKYKKQWKKTNRTDWEKISHVLFSGGFEMGSK